MQIHWNSPAVQSPIAERHPPKQHNAAMSECFPTHLRSGALAIRPRGRPRASHLSHVGVKEGANWGRWRARAMCNVWTTKILAIPLQQSLWIGPRRNSQPNLRYHPFSSSSSLGSPLHPPPKGRPQSHRTPPTQGS